MQTESHTTSTCWNHKTDMMLTLCLDELGSICQEQVKELQLVSVTCSQLRPGCDWLLRLGLHVDTQDFLDALQHTMQPVEVEEAICCADQQVLLRPEPPTHAFLASRFRYCDSTPCFCIDCSLDQC